MDSVKELIPFAKEMLSQKPNRRMVKMYLVGSVFAVLGTVIGLVESMCHPFSSGGCIDEEIIFMMNQEQRTADAKKLRSMWAQGEEEEKEEEEATTQLMIPKTNRIGQRNMSNRLHAS